MKKKEFRKILLKSKKADVHMNEMIFMLIGITLFFSIVLMFYLSFSLSSAKQTVAQSSKIGSVLMAAGLAGSPEFSCPSDLAANSGICIDSDKVLALVTNHKEYSQFWSNDVAGLRIEKVNSGLNQTINCTSGNYERCTTFIIIPTRTSEVDEYASYASLCKIESKAGYKYPECELAKIIIAAEKRS